jgi:hypothetical protein
MATAAATFLFLLIGWELDGYSFRGEYEFLNKHAITYALKGIKLLQGSPGALNK